jgi:hypothetical protein
MACSIAHKVIPFQVNTTCPNRERDGNNKIYANQRQGAWFGLLRTICIDPVHIKGIRSTGVDATNSSSVRTAELLAPRDDSHEGRTGNLLVYISVLKFCSVSRLCTGTTTEYCDLETTVWMTIPKIIISRTS